METKPVGMMKKHIISKEIKAMRNKTPYDPGFASGGVTCKLGALCFYSSVVQVDSFRLRNPPLRQAPKR